MLNRLNRWYRHRKCLLHGHTPRYRYAYSRRGPDGREYLEGRDCIDCGRDRWFLQWADFDLTSLQSPSLGTFMSATAQVPTLPPEVVIGYGKRQLQSRGWQIVEEPKALVSPHPLRPTPRRQTPIRLRTAPPGGHSSS